MTDEPLADAPSSAEPVPPHVSALQRFDAAVAPFLGRLGFGAVHEQQLLAFATSIRHGLAAALGPAPEDSPATGESLDMLNVQRQAARNLAAPPPTTPEQEAAAQAQLDEQDRILAEQHSGTDVEPAKPVVERLFA
jgi:hypothetical protein